MAKERVRADIGQINRSLLDLLEEAERLPGIRPVGFFPDQAGTIRYPDGCLWLIYECNDDDAFKALHDLLVKQTNGAISLKSAGRRLEPGDEGYVGA
jgi:hypothetical protein